MISYLSAAQRYIARGSNALDRLRAHGEPNRVLKYDPAATVLARECLWSIIDAAEYVHRSLRAGQGAVSHEEVLRALTRVSDSMPRDPQVWHVYGPGTRRGHVLVHKRNLLPANRTSRRAPIHAEPFLETRLLELARCVGFD